MRLPRRAHPRVLPRPEVQRLLADAAGVADEFGHNYVGTEHVLLVLAREERGGVVTTLRRFGVTPDHVRSAILATIGSGQPPRRRSLDAEALATLGIDLEEVRRRLEGTFGTGALERTQAGCKCIMPRFKQALEIAAREAREQPIESWHVLIGLTAVTDSVAARILADSGVTETKVRTLELGPSQG